MTSGQIVGKMDTRKELNVPLYPRTASSCYTRSAPRPPPRARRRRCWCPSPPPSTSTATPHERTRCSWTWAPAGVWWECSGSVFGSFSSCDLFVFPGDFSRERCANAGLCFGLSNSPLHSLSAQRFDPRPLGRRLPGPRAGTFCPKTARHPDEPPPLAKRAPNRQSPCHPRLLRAEEGRRRGGGPQVSHFAVNSTS